MRIARASNEDKNTYLPLLLIGDEQEDMIRRYLDQGQMFLLEEDGQVVCAAVMAECDDKTCELKNIAVWPQHQRKGYGLAMLKYLAAFYAARFEKMLLGTGEVPGILRFYQRAGFQESHRLPDFFTVNYSHPIIEDGITLKDMIYLSKHLRPERALQLTTTPLTQMDWPEVEAIYQLGIDTKIAAFRPEVPGWRTWDKGHHLHSRLVAKLNGQIAGWAALSPASDKDYYRGVAELSIYVAPWCQGQGVGKKLLAEIIKEADKNGVWTIESKIIAENEASLALHESCGFKVVGRRSRLGRMDDGIWHDVYLMDYRSQVNGWD